MVEPRPLRFFFVCMTQLKYRVPVVWTTLDRDRAVEDVPKQQLFVLMNPKQRPHGEEGEGTGGEQG